MIQSSLAPMELLKPSLASVPLIVDRAPKFTARFRGLLRDEGVKPLRLPSRTQI